MQEPTPDLETILQTISTDRLCEELERRGFVRAAADFIVRLADGRAFLLKKSRP